MNTEIKNQILQKIIAYDTIIISRHKRPDGDAIGSSYGLCRILRLSYPEKRIFLDSDDSAEYLSFLGGEGVKPSAEDYKNALLIVVDTGTANRISNARMDMAKEIVKIDHHIDDKPYGDLCWIEEERSSACEMITDFYLTHQDTLKIDSLAATYLYTGLVTDSGRFRFRGTNADTLRCASFLLTHNIDLESIYAHLYMEDYEIMCFKNLLCSKIKRTENGVAYLYISRAMRKRHHISLEEASNVVSLMEKIKGSLIWIAFIENDDRSIRVRLRSRFVEIQPLATCYNGGGHACAAGATVYSKEEMEKLIQDANELLGQYKTEHDGWL